MIRDHNFSRVRVFHPLSISTSGFFARALITVAFMAVIALFSAPAQAATITVNGLGDTLGTNGVCTIREAIINANNDAATWPDCAAGSGTDTINLPAGTITLSIVNSPNTFGAENFSAQGDLDILSSMIINGNPGGTTINGGAIDRIFDLDPVPDVNNPTPTPLIVVAINSLAITNGFQNQSGAVRIQANATVTMDSCTISNSNAWADDGGGVYVFSGGSLAMTNCTISGNHALLLAAGLKNEGITILTSCLVTGGTSSFANLVTGVLNSGTMTLANTIVAGNSGDDNPNIAGNCTSLGYNIIGSLGTAGVDPFPVHGPGDQVGVSDAAVQLGPLQNNGGPTPTQALGAGSIAIDKGNSFALTRDQRGAVRPCDDATIANAPGGDGADVGPYEAGACAANSAPDAVDDSATIAEDSGANTINVRTNDSDPDADTLTVTVVTQGAHGSVAIAGGGTNVSYTPNADFFGSDSFTYTIDDGHSHTDTATVHVTVTNVEDAPVANDDSKTINEDSGPNSINVLTNDTDVDGDTLTITAVTQGAHGAAAITGGGTGVSYNPAANFFGTDSFTYTINDGHSGTSTATVHITVLNVNDPPVAVGDSYSTNSNTPLNVAAPGVLGNDSDIDGDSLTTQLVSGPSHAATFALNSNGSFSYNPIFNYTGPDSFTYKAFDGAAFSNTVTVNINVIDTVPPTLNASVTESSLWPPNHDLENVGLSTSASDNSGGPVTIQVAVYSDEDDLAPDSGNFSPDARNIGPSTLRLRSERNGSADGRVYLIVVTATDPSNNVSRVCLTVVVPQSQSAAAQNSVNAQASAARAYCNTHNGAPPPGFFVVGDGPVVGPKQ